MLVALMAANTDQTAPRSITEKPSRILSDALLLIPTLNEEEAIGPLITESQEAGFRDIVVVDGFSNITTAVSVNIAAEAPTKVASGGKKGIDNGKLRIPPRKNVINIFLLVLVTLSNVFPKT